MLTDPQAATLASGDGLLALLSLSVPAVALLFWRRVPRLGLAGAAFFVLSFIGSSIVIPIGVPYAERLYYPATIALALAVSCAAEHLRSRPLQIAGTVALVAWLGWCAALLIERVPVWRDSATLFAHDYEHQPRSARIALNHAGQLRTSAQRAPAGPSGHAQKAILDAIERAVRLDPERALAWNELGIERGRSGDFAGALEAFTRGLGSQRTEGIQQTQILQNYAVSLVRVDPQRAVTEFDRIAATLGTDVSLQWLLEFTTKLEQAAPKARSDWPCLRAALCRARQDLRAARPHLRACRDRLERKPPRLTLDLILAELADGNPSAARTLLRELESVGIPDGMAAEVEQVRVQLGH